MISGAYNTCYIIMASIEYWKDRWSKGTTGWHINFVDTHLQKYIDVLTDGKIGLSILVPLCGKSLDLKWLADKGHKVFGVEISEQAVSEIFTDAGLSAKVTPVGNDSTLYEACDGRLKVLAGDVFSLNSDICGQFDSIWDKNSFGAINPVDRDRYVDLIHSLLKPQGRILMCAYVYNQTERNCPPFSVSSDVLKSHYGKAYRNYIFHHLGSRFNIEFLESIECREKKETFKLSSLDRLLHIIRKID